MTLSHTAGVVPDIVRDQQSVAGRVADLSVPLAVVGRVPADRAQLGQVVQKHSVGLGVPPAGEPAVAAVQVADGIDNSAHVPKVSGTQWTAAARTGAHPL